MRRSLYITECLAISGSWFLNSKMTRNLTQTKNLMKIAHILFTPVDVIKL